MSRVPGIFLRCTVSTTRLGSTCCTVVQPLEQHGHWLSPHERLNLGLVASKPCYLTVKLRSDCEYFLLIIPNYSWLCCTCRQLLISRSRSRCFWRCIETEVNRLSRFFSAIRDKYRYSKINSALIMPPYLYGKPSTSEGRREMGEGGNKTKNLYSTPPHNRSTPRTTITKNQIVVVVRKTATASWSPSNLLRTF